MRNRLIRTISTILVIKLTIIVIPCSCFSVNAANPIYETCWKEYNLGTGNKGYYLEPSGDGKFPDMIFVHGAGGISGIPKDTLRNLVEYWASMGYMDEMVIIIPNIEKGSDPSIYEAFRLSK